MRNFKFIIIIVLCVFLILSLSIAGCKTTTTGTAETTAAPKSDVTLHMLMEDVPDTRVIETLLPEFTAATGIKVEMEIVQYLDMHQKLVDRS